MYQDGEESFMQMPENSMDTMDMDNAELLGMDGNDQMDQMTMSFEESPEDSIHVQDAEDIQQEEAKAPDAVPVETSEIEEEVAESSVTTTEAVVETTAAIEETSEDAEDGKISSDDLTELKEE